VDVPVQFFQSTIAIELAVAGALLWQIRYFDRGGAAGRDMQELPDARLQFFFALVLGATLFRSLWAIADEGKALAASLVTTGVAVSLLPWSTCCHRWPETRARANAVRTTLSPSAGCCCTSSSSVASSP
jgi:hypothetical protein